MSDKKPPLHTVRIGNIKASVWENQSTTGKKFFTTTLARSYRDEHEQWHDSFIYFADDLPKIELATKKAFEFIYAVAAERQQQSAEGKQSHEEGAKQVAESTHAPEPGAPAPTHAQKIAAERAGGKKGAAKP